MKTSKKYPNSAQTKTPYMTTILQHKISAKKMKTYLNNKFSRQTWAYSTDQNQKTKTTNSLKINSRDILENQKRAYMEMNLGFCLVLVANN